MPAAARLLTSTKMRMERRAKRRNRVITAITTVCSGDGGEGGYHGFITWCGSDMSPDNDTRSLTTLKWDLEGFIGLRASTWKTGICTKTPARMRLASSVGGFNAAADPRPRGLNPFITTSGR